MIARALAAAAAGGLLAATCAGIVAAPAAAAPQPIVKTAAFAATALTACQDFAAGAKLPPISIAILDTSGTLVLFARQPGASAASADTALLKARSALRMGLPTAVLVDLAAKDPPTAGALQLLGIVAMAGGSPLKLADGTMIGAVGVSGARPEDDGGCVAAAASAIR